jgi:hypothetical protein
MPTTKAGLHLAGQSFGKEQTSLHDLLQAYDAFEGILDCTYSNATGMERFSDSVRKQYQIIIRETRYDSWDTIFDIVIALSPVIFGNALSGMDLLAAAKATFDFLRFTFSLKKDGTIYTINNDANGTVNVVLEGGHQTNFYAPVSINLVANAKDMVPELQKLLDLVEKGSLETAEIENESQQKVIQIGTKEAGLLKLEDKTGSEQYDFDGEIYRYNKRSRTGRLQVKELQELPPGNYTFKVADPNIQDDVIVSMIKRTTTISARPIVVDDPITNQEVIHHLEILDV